MTICCILGCSYEATKQRTDICHSDHIWYFCDEHNPKIKMIPLKGKKELEK